MATSYANSLGTGNRTASITATSNVGNDAGVPVNMVNGDTATNDGTNSWDPVAASMNDGSYTRFDFGSGVKKYMDEIKLYTSSTPPGGTFIFRASNDLSAYDNGATFTWDAATKTVTLTGLSTVGYQYFELYKSGNASDTNAWWREIEFKIDAGVAAAVAFGGSRMLLGVG